jgi:hypothetical protein
MSHIPDQSSNDAVPALDMWLSFDDLRRAGIVSNWKTLREWQRDERIGFPKGKLLAPNTRRWSKHHEIDPWLKDRPVERDGFDEDASTSTLTTSAPSAEVPQTTRPAR